MGIAAQGPQGDNVTNYADPPNIEVEGGFRASKGVGRVLLGGSWVVISRGMSRVTIVMTHIRGLITILITTHEPPSRRLWKRFGFRASGSQALGSLDSKVPSSSNPSPKTLH